MLDDDRRRIPEFGHQLECGIGIVQVVVAERLSLDLFGGRDARPGQAFRQAVERRRLMRILAIAERLTPFGGDHQPRREQLAQRAADPARHHAVIGRGVPEGAGRHAGAELCRDGAAAGLEFAEKLEIVRRIGDHGHAVMGLRGRPDHRRAADVDALDQRIGIRALGEAGLERVEVDDDQIDHLDAMRLERRPILRDMAPGEQAAMDGRMQGLHPAVQDLREAGDLGDLGDRHAGIPDGLRRSAGRDHLDPVVGESFRQVGQPRLVRNGKEGPLDFHRSRRPGDRIALSHE